MPRRWCQAQTVIRLSRALPPPRERGAEEQVVVMEVAARCAGRHRAPPAVAREDRVAVPRLALPLGLDVLEQALEPAPARLAGLGKDRDRLAQQDGERGGRVEDDLRA